ncbi:hypothetical protein KM915_20990 [Cytobacillus oceanisediminis]|uniref:hypothetical protein n=1 Tax=Cytobacillus oceanisediminis TaxID=665099 RepID=UPI001C244334|nr:hypothetical protein [Cytobacillus oceanisediminis]MBU8732528.1 hypothetical protein [Cytobacillus oceanisediminis]
MNIRLIDLNRTHILGVIETKKGNEYACTFAKEKDKYGSLSYPTKSDVKDAWSENKRDFQTYKSFH